MITGKRAGELKACPTETKEGLSMSKELADMYQGLRDKALLYAVSKVQTVLDTQDDDRLAVCSIRGVIEATTEIVARYDKEIAEAVEEGK